jgi:hypothetical protein
MSADQAISQGTELDPKANDFTDQDFDTEMRDYENSDPHTYSKECASSKEEMGYVDSYQPPPGFKLIPENYVGVEPTMYAMLLRSLGQDQGGRQIPSEIKVQLPQTPKEEPDLVFHIKLLQQLTIGDIGYNFVRNEEFVYCPSKKYIEVGGDKYTTLRSFLNVWNAHYGPRPDPNVKRKPFFLILNPETCPPIHESLGRRPPSQYRTDAERIQSEQSRGDAAHNRVHLHGETSEYSVNLTATNPVDPRDIDRNPDETMHPDRRPGAYIQSQFDPRYQQDDQSRVQNAQEYRQRVFQKAHGMVRQPVDPQEELQQMVNSPTPIMPPRAGIVGTDGLTQRARMIKGMSGDQIQRPVQRTQIRTPVGGYEPPETVENFPVEYGQMGGGRIVGHIQGGPADEATAQAQMNDVEAMRLQGLRSHY